MSEQNLVRVIDADGNETTVGQSWVDRWPEDFRPVSEPAAPPAEPEQEPAPAALVQGEPEPAAVTPEPVQAQVPTPEAKPVKEKSK